MSWDRFTFCADLHGEEQDKSTVTAFLKFCKVFKPKIKVFGGDLWDFKALRRKASKEEQAHHIGHDVDLGINFLKEYRPDTLLLGNHDFRLWDIAENGSGASQERAMQAVREIERECAALKCTIKPYHKERGILKIGHLKMLHGFFFGVYAAKRHAEVYGACLFGHTHTIGRFPIPGIERRVASDVGCLCNLDMDYDSRMPNSLRHANGWAYGVSNSKTGAYKVLQAEKIGGKWILPTKMEIL